MTDFILYNEFTGTRVERLINAIEIPDIILSNINKRIVLRDYQETSIKRFIEYFENKNDYQSQIVNDDLYKSNKNHILFNMATGSGKTVIMACLILYLYEKGYRNFLFLSHLNSINTKTYGNLLDKKCNKYLFDIDSNIDIREGQNGELKNNEDINIFIKTYAGLLSDIKTIKENNVSLENFKNNKIAIISDESHHLNAGVEKESGEWEDVVNKILNANSDNFLLEFTATIPWEKLEKKTFVYKEKYNSKCIVKYDINSFYKEKWTKFIDILQRDVDIENLMLGGVILNKYREVLSLETLTPFKPVIMFKSNKIDISKENHRIFNNLIENLNGEKLNLFYRNLDDSIVKQGFDYLLKKYNSINDLIYSLKEDFSEKYIINTNSKEEVENESSAKLLNSLEDKSNQKRIIFTVDKLNEGWDVLNLFDIVKLYKTQSVGETTQEAQLLGRGARYCNFEIENYNYEPYKRKFDSDRQNKFEILEHLYFHSKQDNKSINALKEELQKIRPEEQKELISIKLKPEYEEKLKDKIVFHNTREQKSLISNEYNVYDEIKQLANTFTFNENSYKEQSFNVMDNDNIKNDLLSYNSSQTLQINDIPSYIKENALINKRFFNFNELYQKLNIKSFSDFLDSLNNLNLTIHNIAKEQLDDIKLQYRAFSSFLDKIEGLLKKEIAKYEGTKEFISKSFFTDNKGIFRKNILLNRTKDKNIKTNCDYYIYDNAYLTIEEENFINFFNDKIYNKLKAKFDEDKIYLVRNENDLKLYKFKDGSGFEPDFILFLTKGDINYQIFIEPKGDHLLKEDEAKNEFLKEITKLFKDGKLNVDKNIPNKDDIREHSGKFYNIIGLQFYNANIETKENRMQNEFESLIFK